MRRSERTDFRIFVREKYEIRPSNPVVFKSDLLSTYVKINFHIAVHRTETGKTTHPELLEPPPKIAELPQTRKTTRVTGRYYKRQSPY